MDLLSRQGLRSRSKAAGHASSSVSSRGSWGVPAALATTNVLPLALYLGVQREGYQQVLGLSRLQLTGEEPWLVPAVIISTSALLLLPGLVLAALLHVLGRPRASRICFIALSSLALFALLVDLDLLRSIGRHLSETVAVALLPQGHVAAGNEAVGWLRSSIQWCLLALLGSGAASALCQYAVRAAAPRLTPLLRRTLLSAGGLWLLALILVPHLMRDGWHSSILYERVYGTLFFDLRPSRSNPEDNPNTDPALHRLYPHLRDAYQAAFATLLGGKPLDHSKLELPARPPNVVLVVIESLRHDVFGSELMPRLTRWSEKGLVAAQHGSDTIYSQAGLFALLYGRSPAVFHQTLDAQVPPQFCSTLRASGYQCAYFTGQPKVWLRQEEFLNEHTMDRFVHDDRGTWPEWDQRALDNAVQLLSSTTQPTFAIVLLMSSHFEYQYPPGYEIDKPVSTTAWHVTPVTTLGPEAEIPHRNRYRNCIRFIDDVVSDALEKLDPERNLVIVTGDHGESINDDGHYTHGFTFSDIVTRTPLAIVGPGVAPGRLDVPTSHVDVLPTVLHLLSQRHVALNHIQGRDWLAEEPLPSVLESFEPDQRDRIKVQLRADGLRLRLDLNLREPHVTLLGFEDTLGRLTPTPALSDAAVDSLAQAFEEQLRLLRR